MRRGLAAAATADAAGACAEPGGAAIVAPANPKAVAALPERKFRRLTGGPAKAPAGSQQTHCEKNPRRPARPIMFLRALPMGRIVGGLFGVVKRTPARVKNAGVSASARARSAEMEF